MVIQLPDGKVSLRQIGSVDECCKRAIEIGYIPSWINKDDGTHFYHAGDKWEAVIPINNEDRAIRVYIDFVPPPNIGDKLREAGPWYVISMARENEHRNAA